MTSTPLRRALRVALVLAALPAVAPAAASASTWTVDDDRAQCPSAGFTTIQKAVDQAAPWDTVVVCDGVYREQSTPYTSVNSPAQAGSRNGLTITKPLTIRGAGADKVTIMPATALGDSLAGTEPYLRDGGGNVITVSRQSLGASDDNENFFDLSGVTVTSPGAYVEAGIAFFNTSGRVSKSVVGPLRRAAAANAAAQPHGWGVVMTNSLQSDVPGGIRREVTIEDSLVTGFGAGGVLFDASVGGIDNPTVTAPAVSPLQTRSNVNAYGNVVRSRIVGEAGGASVPQTGVRFQSGQRGRVTDSEIVDTWSGQAAAARTSLGVLLADADTGIDPKNPGVRALQISGTTFGGNGYAVYNADAANAAVRNGAPVSAIGNYWGCPSGPLGAASSAITGCQGRSGNDAGTPAAGTTPAVPPAPSVDASGFLTTPAVALSVPAKTADAAPTAEILEPIADTVVPVGTTISPVVQASDDFGVTSVSLTAGGLPVATISKRPFEFSWTPTAAQAGTTVALAATVTDSSGQTTTTTVPVTVPALPAGPGGGPSGPGTEPTGPGTTPTTPTGPTTPTTPGGTTTPPAGTPAAKRTVRVLTRSVRLDSKGRFALRISCAKGITPCKVRVLVKRGSTQVAVRTLTIRAGATYVMQVRPSSAMRRTLLRGRSATVKVSLSGTAVKPVKPVNVKVLPRRR
jgi:hypothetical protein